jgi:hypothetical protein
MLRQPEGARAKDQRHNRPARLSRARTPSTCRALLGPRQRGFSAVLGRLRLGIRAFSASAAYTASRATASAGSRLLRRASARARSLPASTPGLEPIATHVGRLILLRAIMPFIAHEAA